MRQRWCECEGYFCAFPRETNLYRSRLRFHPSSNLTNHLRGCASQFQCSPQVCGCTTPGSLRRTCHEHLLRDEPRVGTTSRSSRNCSQQIYPWASHWSPSRAKSIWIVNELSSKDASGHPETSRPTRWYWSSWSWGSSRRLCATCQQSSWARAFSSRERSCRPCTPCSSWLFREKQVYVSWARQAFSYRGLRDQCHLYTFRVESYLRPIVHLP